MVAVKGLVMVEKIAFGELAHINHHVCTSAKSLTYQAAVDIAVLQVYYSFPLVMNMRNFPAGPSSKCALEYQELSMT